jgi:excisionase family DNA binding protein
MTDEVWWTIQDLAAYLGFSVSTIQKMAVKKLIPAYNLTPWGKKAHWRFKKSDIDNMPPMM